MHLTDEYLIKAKIKTQLTQQMNIAIVDDHLLFAQLLKNNLLRSFKGSVIKTYSEPAVFLSTDFGEWLPEIVICDLIMPGMDGMEVVRKVRSLFGGKCKLIIMSGVTEIVTVRAALVKGANGYVAKDADLEELLIAINVVKDGGQYISAKLKENILGYMITGEPDVFSLSPKEKEVLQKFCSGMIPKEIAEDMNLSIHTINQYNKNIMKKFKVNRTTDMILLAIQKGLCTTPPVASGF